MIRKDMRLRAAIVVGVAWFFGACADSEDLSSSNSLDAPSAADTSTADTSTTEMAMSDASTVVTSTSVSATRVEGLLFDFDSQGSVDGWYVQNDTVMGGVSSSSVALDDGAMVFSGI
ncbi:MAG: CIA30 family protein, partial [Ilumatobacteraceae bacterium]